MRIIYPCDLIRESLFADGVLHVYLPFCAFICMCLPTLLIVYPRTCICLCPLTSLVARSSRSFVNVYLRALLGVCLLLYLCLDVFFPSVCEISCILASFCIGLYVGILRIHFHVSVPRFSCVSMAVPASVSFLFFFVYLCVCLCQSA